MGLWSGSKGLISRGFGVIFSIVFSGCMVVLWVEFMVS